MKSCCLATENKAINAYLADRFGLLSDKITIDKILWFFQESELLKKKQNVFKKK